MNKRPLIKVFLISLLITSASCLLSTVSAVRSEPKMVSHMITTDNSESGGLILKSYVLAKFLEPGKELATSTVEANIHIKNGIVIENGNIYGADIPYTENGNHQWDYHWLVLGPLCARRFVLIFALAVLIASERTCRNNSQLVKH